LQGRNLDRKDAARSIEDPGSNNLAKGQRKMGHEIPYLGEIPYGNIIGYAVILYLY
jgi:hypothetical protein